jgi:hypothetical protein
MKRTSQTLLPFIAASKKSKKTKCTLKQPILQYILPKELWKIIRSYCYLFISENVLQFVSPRSQLQNISFLFGEEILVYNPTKQIFQILASVFPHITTLNNTFFNKTPRRPKDYYKILQQFLFLHTLHLIFDSHLNLDDIRHLLGLPGIQKLYMKPRYKELSSTQLNLLKQFGSIKQIFVDSFWDPPLTVWSKNSALT